MTELNHENQVEQEAPPLLEVILKELDDIKDKWREVGEVLKVSKAKLDDIQERGVNDKDNFRIVLKEWMDKNMSMYMWSPLLQALNNSTIDMNPSRIEQLCETYSGNRAEDCARNDERDSDHRPDDQQDDAAIAADDNDHHDQQDDAAAADDDNDHHDHNHQGKCYCLIRCCCCPCRTIIPWCKKAIGPVCQVFIYMIIAIAILLPGVHYNDSEKIDEFTKFLMENQRAADRLLEVGVRPIRILVTGKTGTGKSSLINGIIGDNVTEEGSSLDPTTTEVQQFKRTVRGVPMFVFDSPGLQDGTENEKEYLLDIERKCKKVDLVLYTMKMTDKRLHSEDVEAMKKLTNAFGEKFWENSMFVMTFANEIRNPEKPDNEDENRKAFETSLHQWIKKLQTTLEKLKVSNKIAKSIPVVPAGYHKNRHLPGHRYWFSQFFKSILARMKEFSDEGHTFMFHFNSDRFRRENETTQEELEKNLHEQPIIKFYDQLPRNSTLRIPWLDLNMKLLISAGVTILLILVFILIAIAVVKMGHSIIVKLR